MDYEIVDDVDYWLDNNVTGLYSYTVQALPNELYYVIFFDTTFDAIRFKMDFSRYAFLTQHSNNAMIK